MKHFFTVISLSSILSISCSNKKNEIFLPIQFGISEHEQTKMLSELVIKKVLWTEVNKYGDTAYFKNLTLGNKLYKVKTYLNGDELGSGGPLRSYVYGLATQLYSQTDNDTTNVPDYLLDSKVIKVSTFIEIRNFFDETYGKPQISVENHPSWSRETNDSIFRYSLDSLDILLTHGEIVGNNYYKVNFINQFYDKGYIYIQSKNFERELEKEKNRRVAMLKPEDAVELTFKNAYIRESAAGDTLAPGSYYPYINSEVTNEFNKIDYFLINDDIIKVKGILQCLNAYNEELANFEIDYKFNFPLVSRGKIQTTNGLFQSFTLNPPSDNYSKYSNDKYWKVYNVLSKGEEVKLKFIPIAVVFSNGFVLKD